MLTTYLRLMVNACFVELNLKQKIYLCLFQFSLL